MKNFDIRKLENFDWVDIPPSREFTPAIAANYLEVTPVGAPDVERVWLFGSAAYNKFSADPKTDSLFDPATKVAYIKNGYMGQFLGLPVLCVIRADTFPKMDTNSVSLLFVRRTETGYEAVETHSFS